MRKTKNIWVLIIGFVFVGWVSISIALPNNTVFFGTGCSNPLVNQNVTVRDSIGATVNYQSLWEYEGDFIPFQGLQILNNAVSFSDGDCARVVALELTTGNELWTANINGPKQIAIDDSRNVIYVYGLQNVQLIALNNSGDTLWINHSLRGQRTGITPYVLSDGRLFAFAGSLGFVSVDPTTGEFGTTVNLPDIGELFRYIGEEYLWLIINSSLQARELETSEVEWVSEYEGFLECCLEQVEKTTIITLVYFHSALFALDNENGELLWTFQDPSIVSNFVVNDGRVTFLDENAELHILDILTGDSLASIPFSPPPPEARRFASGDNQIGSSLIAYIDDIVVIYFGDTAYLSAYQVTFDD